MLLHEHLVPRKFLHDLVAISSLPELWLHRTPEEIAAGLAGVLANTLSLDMIYLSFNTKPDQSRIEVAYSKSEKLRSSKAQQIGQSLAGIMLDPDAQESPVVLPNPVGDGFLRAVVTPIGITAEHGYLVAASRAHGFPDEFNQLLLRVAINQATVILRQKQAEEELRRKQQELTDFFENASEGLHWAELDGKIIWANQAELDMLGYAKEEYIGHLEREFHADTVVAEDILHRLANDQPVREYEARLRCKDGSIKYALINSTVYRENEKFIHTRCFTRDITERKQMEDALRRAYDETEMRVEFRAKELSAAIKALKEEIAVRTRAETEVAELRGRLAESRESERLLLAQELHDGPIQDLLALSYRITPLLESTPSDQLNSVQTEIMQIIGKLRTLCEELRPSTLISFGLEKAIRAHLEQFQKQYRTFDVQAELAEEIKLPERISLALYRIYQQALANIVRHAQADQISIHYQMENNRAILEIQDNGCGFLVPPNWIEFAREGHLGLIGGFERAEAVGGKLLVESAPGKGTRIQVTVPIPNSST